MRAAAQGARAVRESAPALSEPAFSPDRSEIAFVAGGDIWSVPSAGGDARLLVSHSAYDSRPLFSPDGTLAEKELWPMWSADGKSLFFVGDRDGNENLWTRPASPGGTVERLTLGNNLQEPALSPDGKKAAFAVRDEIFAASAKEGGEAARVTTSPAVEGQLAWARTHGGSSTRRIATVRGRSSSTTSRPAPRRR